MRKNKQLILDYKALFNSEKGKNILNDLRRKCPLMDNALDTSQGIDTNKVCYLEGQRSVILHIFKMMDTDPYEERSRKALMESRNDNL